MSGLDARIENLMNYAESRGGGDRTILFRNLIDLFLTSQAPVRQPMRRQLIALLSSLLKDVDQDTRRTAADLVAGIASPPLDLATALACDDSADLVERLLLETPFDEEALMIIIDRTTKTHHQILASRTDLSANVWIALARAAPAGRQNGISSAPSNHGINTLSGNVTPIDQSPKRRGRSGSSTSFSGSQMNIQDLHASNPQWHNANNHRTDPASFIGVEDWMTETIGDNIDADTTENGWSFQSDRDGFITGLSSTGRALYSRTGTAKGAPLLDFLGLNAKLDHPIARAFQRRTTLKESALFLGNLPKGKRHWVLSARPQFHSSTGVFLGYDCFLRPPVTNAAASSSSTGKVAPVLASPALDKAGDDSARQPDQASQSNRLSPLCQVPDDILANQEIDDALTSRKTGVSPETAAQVSKSLEALGAISSDILSESPSPQNYDTPTVESYSPEGLSSHNIASKVEKEVRRAVEAAFRDTVQNTGRDLAAGEKLEPAEPVIIKADRPQHNPRSNPKPDDSVRFVTQDYKDLIGDALDSLTRALGALQDDEQGKRKANRSLQWTIAGSALNAIKDVASPDD